MLVIDASAAVEAALALDGFGALGDEDLIGPPLLWSEASSVLHELAWRGAVPAGKAREAFDRLEKAPLARRRPARLAQRAWAVADELGWAKTYDAEYVALAALTACPLLTVEARLRRGASRLVEVVAPADV